MVDSPLFSVSPRRFWHANGTHLALVVPELPGPGPWTFEPQPTNVNHDGGSSNDQARVCQCNHHRASATLPDDVRESRPRQQKRDGGPSGDDFFVPKQLGWGRCLGLVRLSTGLMVHGSSCSSAVVRRRCHAVRHSCLPCISFRCRVPGVSFAPQSALVVGDLTRAPSSSVLAWRVGDQAGRGG